MIRGLLTLLQLLLIAGLAVYLVQESGLSVIQWGEYRIETQSGYLAVALLIMGIFVLALHRLFIWMRHWPRRLKETRIARAHIKGDQALVRSLSALAAGDYKTGYLQAQKARKYLPHNTQLSLVLLAHTARLEGRAVEAARAFDEMMQHPETAFLGLKGLLQGALDQNDYQQALLLARRAADLHKRDPGAILKTVYELELRQREWHEAEKTLLRASRKNVIDPSQADSDRIAFRHIEADRLLRDNQMDAAIQHLRDAYKIDPYHVPTVLKLGNLWAAQKKRQRISAMIEKIWRREPHPDLVALWEAVRDTQKSNDPQMRMIWIEKLVAFNPARAESQLAAASAAIDEGFWSEARAYLVMAEKISPTQRVYKLFAQLEDKTSRQADIAREWMEKAADAPMDKVWICSITGRIYSEWAPIAEPHGSFNSIIWDDPRPRPVAQNLAADDDPLLLSAA